MIKPTPNPPETDPTSPYESLDSNKLHEAADRALDHYLSPNNLLPPPRKARHPGPLPRGVRGQKRR